LFYAENRYETDSQYFNFISSFVTKKQTSLEIDLFLISCTIGKNQSSNDKITQKEYDELIGNYIEKYNFPIEHSDTLKKVKSFLLQSELTKVDSFITKSLFYYMINEIDLTFTEKDYKVWYYVPEHTVSIYTLFFSSEKIEEIENGIEIKQD